MPRLDGIDISHYQSDKGPINWNAVKATGIKWIGIKATQGVSSRDSFFSSHRLGATQAGIRQKLYYHWLSANVAAESQAAWFISVVGKLAPGEGVMLDAEEAGITADLALRFCRIVESYYGRPVAVYTGVYVAGGNIWKSPQLFDGTRPRILAAYTSEAKAKLAAAPYGWDAWQYTGSGTFPGITGAVDLDQIDNPAIFDKVCGLTSKPIQTAPPFQGASDMSIAILAPQDDPARFLAEVSAQGAAINCQWTGDGSDPKVASRVAAHIAAGATQLNLYKRDLINVRIEGPLPPGWTKADFANLAGD